MEDTFATMMKVCVCCWEDIWCYGLFPLLLLLLLSKQQYLLRTRSLPVRKGRLSSSVHFVSTKTAGRTRPSPSQTPARILLEPGASERREKELKQVKSSWTSVVPQNHWGSFTGEDTESSSVPIISAFKPYCERQTAVLCHLKHKLRVQPPESVKSVLFSWDCQTSVFNVAQKMNQICNRKYNGNRFREFIMMECRWLMCLNKIAADKNICVERWGGCNLH